MEVRYNKIGEVLKRRNKTSYWLATVLGVSPSVTHRWVHQERQPTLLVLHEIATALKVEAKMLLVSTNEVKEQLPERFAEIEEKRNASPGKRGPKPKE